MAEPSVRPSAPRPVAIAAAASRFGPERAIAGVVHRQLWRGALAVGGASALAVAVSFRGYRRAYDTTGQRQALAEAMSSNDGVVALFGEPHGIDAIGGFVAWRSAAVLTVIAAVWAIVAVSSAVRGAEDDGRWDLLVAGATTRARATAAAFAGLTAAVAGIFGPVLVACWAFGVRQGDVSRGDALLLAMTLSTAPLWFGAVALACGQVAPRRGRAVALAGGFLGASFAVRLIADGVGALSRARWASPHAWLLEVRPMAGARPALLGLLVATMALVLAGALWLCARRDVGAAPWPERPPAPRRSPRSVARLTLRLVRPGALGWLALVGSAAFVFGLVAAGLSGPPLPGFGGQRGPDGYLSTTFLLLAVLLAVAVAGVLAQVQREEGSGRIDHLLVRPVRRRRWFAGWLAAAGALVLTGGVLAGVAAWAGNRLGGGSTSMGGLLAAGVNLAAPALTLVGVGAVVFALVPRRTAAVAYGIVAGSFILEILGVVLDLPSVVVSLSVFHHPARLPAADPAWGSWAALVAIGAAAAGIAVAALPRRDLEPD